MLLGRVQLDAGQLPSVADSQGSGLFSVCSAHTGSAAEPGLCECAGGSGQSATDAAGHVGGVRSHAGALHEIRSAWTALKMVHSQSRDMMMHYSQLQQLLLKEWMGYLPAIQN